MTLTINHIHFPLIPATEENLKNLKSGDSLQTVHDQKHLTAYLGMWETGNFDCYSDYGAQELVLRENVTGIWKSGTAY
jgi:hypothetical protein